MIVSDPQGGKVLVSAQGNINLVIEPERRKGAIRLNVERHFPTIAAASLAAAVVGFGLAGYSLYRLHNGIEERVESRIQQLDSRLETLISTLDSGSERRSDTLIQHVDRLGDRVDQVGTKVEQISDHVDLLPATIDKAASGSSSSVIGWLSALKSPEPAPTLTVRGPVRRRRQ